MGERQLTNPEREARLDQAVVSFLEAVEAGQTPNPEQWLETHPDLQAELQQFFADQREVGHWTDSLRSVVRVARADAQTKPGEASGGAKPDTAATLPRDFADYELLEEIGRGGMGVVYKAIQVSLGRRVALKILRFACALDRQQLQRFQIEARAAASLEHPHIVPVFGVGCENSVHY